MEPTSEGTKQKLKELRALREVVLARIKAAETELMGIDIRIRAVERRGQFR